MRRGKRHDYFTCRDHNATSYSTETFFLLAVLVLLAAEIITLRAIALKRCSTTPTCGRPASRDHNATSYSTETLSSFDQQDDTLLCRDHNATSYSTETCGYQDRHRISDNAEIITLRAIALKPLSRHNFWRDVCSRDHNATSYSTETY